MQITDNKIKVSQPILKLQKLAQQNFTGSLSIQNNQNLSWKIYFRLGRLIWLTGEGNWFQAQWERHIKSFFRDLSNSERSILLNKNQDEHYKILARLYRQGNAAEKENINDLITSIFVENIFDIIQDNYRDREELLYQCFPNEKPETLVNLIKTDLVCQQAMNNWVNWVKAGLSAYSPNLFPAIENLKIVQKELDSQLISTIDGKKSIRTIAEITNINPITLTKSLVPLAKVRGISLNLNPNLKEKAMYPEDLKESVNESISGNFISSSCIQRKSSFLVFCIDDSSIICQTMEKIVSQKSYRFNSIQNPIQAISLIIKKSPNLIFLDIMMPVINGYELCAQLRKIPRFKEVPIVILTGKDGLVDRVRAKVVGATAFISKPPKPEEVLGLLEKYLLIEN